MSSSAGPSSIGNRKLSGSTPSNTSLAKQKSVTGKVQKHVQTIRLLIQVQEAGQLIGKSGQTVAQIRRDSILGCNNTSNGNDEDDSKEEMVRIRLTEFQRGLKERVVSVSGGRLQLRNAFSSILAVLSQHSKPVDSELPPSSSSSNKDSGNSRVVSLLVPNSFIGVIIGKAGHRIQDIQSQTGARFVASEEVLPNSTDRLLTISGTNEQVERGFDAFLDVVYGDADKNSNTVQEKRLYGHFNYEPVVGHSVLSSYRVPSSPSSRKRPVQSSDSLTLPVTANVSPHKRSETPGDKGEVITKTINVPALLVGAIIGRQGRRINDLRRLSNTQISIAEKEKDDSTERQITVTGSEESIERVLKMIYGFLDTERERLEMPRVVKSTD